MRLDLYITPREIPDNGLTDRTAVVIDVLRASTTLVAAIASGCREVIPVETVERATDARRRLGPQNVLICGERGGKKIQGFDLGNSPREYLPESVFGKAIVFTSTNGSRAMTLVRGCRLGLVGAFTNAGAVARRILVEGADAAILCSGRENALSIEDLACGGLIASRLMEALPDTVLNDGARTGLVVYERHAGDILQLLRTADHGRHLLRIGFEEDLPLCAAVDTTEVVPVIRDGKVVKG